MRRSQRARAKALHASIRVGGGGAELFAVAHDAKASKPHNMPATAPFTVASEDRSEGAGDLRRESTELDRHAPRITGAAKIGRAHV